MNLRKSSFSLMSPKCPSVWTDRIWRFRIPFSLWLFAWASSFRSSQRSLIFIALFFSWFFFLFFPITSRTLSIPSMMNIWAFPRLYFSPYPFGCISGIGHLWCPAALPGGNIPRVFKGYCHFTRNYQVRQTHLRLQIELYL